VQRALLGIRIQDVNARLSEQEDLEILEGVYITEVNPNSAADEAGMQAGDVIIGIDKKPVNNFVELQEQIAVNRPGDDVLVTYYRNGKEKDVVATLKNAEGTLAIVEAKTDYELDGATFIEVSAELKRKLNIEGGVQITDINGGKWEIARIKEGFIITEIDNRQILGIKDLQSFFDKPRGDGILIEGVYPDGEKAWYGMGL
jgi:hypothetical protein